MSKIEPRSYHMRDGRDLLIREAVPADAQVILEHVDQISSESDYLILAPGEFELTVEQEEEYLQNSFLSENSLYIISFVDGDLAGALSFAGDRRKRIRHSGELAMSVKKEYWAQGIGSRLMDALIGWASEGQIIKKINLRVRADNDRAIRLYENKGFTREGVIRRGIRVEGRYYDLYWMGLEL